MNEDMAQAIYKTVMERVNGIVWEQHIQETKAHRLGDAVLSGARAYVRDLRDPLEVLMQISNPSYVGNYPPEKVVEIYRKWARQAIESEEAPE